MSARGVADVLGLAYLVDECNCQLSPKKQDLFQSPRMATPVVANAKIARVATSLTQPIRLRPLSRLPIASTFIYSHHLYPSTRPRHLTTSSRYTAPGSSILGNAGGSGSSATPSTYFQRPALPANTVIRFVPQQTAWVVERMGKYDRILQPGLAILLPFLDRIAYVKSLKEAAMEIPSQSAITADNVTLELDGVLYTRVFDAYKARY